MDAAAQGIGLPVVYCRGVLLTLTGTLPQWLTVIALAAAAYALWRGAGGTALSTLQTANRVLERRVHELEAQSREDMKMIAELRGKTDVALAVKPFMEWATLHETHAHERHVAMVNVLDMIADRLGPDAAS